MMYRYKDRSTQDTRYASRLCCILTRCTRTSLLGMPGPRQQGSELLRGRHFLTLRTSRGERPGDTERWLAHGRACLLAGELTRRP
eukprot:170908-Hanusia_phi.AAC.1